MALPNWQHSKEYRIGITIYTHSTILRRSLPAVSKLSFVMHTECCATLMTKDKLKMTVAVIYRPPLGDKELFLNQITTLINNFKDSHQNIVVCGDLNIDSLKTNNTNHKLLSGLLS